MAVTVNVQLEILTTGDGENQVDVFNWAPNPNAPRSPSKVLVNGNTSVSVPVAARGMVVIAPSAAGAYAVKGVSGDTGVSITAGGVLACRFSAPGAISSFVLSGTPSGLWTIIWA